MALRQESGKAMRCRRRARLKTPVRNERALARRARAIGSDRNHRPGPAAAKNEQRFLIDPNGDGAALAKARAEALATRTDGTDGSFFDRCCLPHHHLASNAMSAPAANPMRTKRSKTSGLLSPLARF